VKGERKEREEKGNRSTKVRKVEPGFLKSGGLFPPRFVLRPFERCARLLGHFQELLHLLVHVELYSESEREREREGGREREREREGEREGERGREGEGESIA
jgi:hypothetical protein